jgi:ribosomal protein S18 acetylase RimI-like enzyme
VFGGTLDADGQRILSDSTRASEGPSFLWRLNPTAGRLGSGFVWEENGRIIGNVTLLTSKTPGRFLVVNVAVHPDYRQRGIARSLMAQVTQLVRRRGGNQILLQVVKDNTPALELYQSLHYTTIGSMTMWHSSVARLRTIDSGRNEPVSRIRELRGHEWSKAYTLDQTSMDADLNWPDLLSSDCYRLTMWGRMANFINGRHVESWVTADECQELTGLVNIMSEWGRTHVALVRVHPAWRGKLERPLVAQMVHRLQEMPRRNIRIDHPDDDTLMNELLRETNFAPRRTLTHMRLDL